MTDAHALHDHHHAAAMHLETAAELHGNAAQCALAGDHVAAYHFAHLAHGHKLHASAHVEAAAKQMAQSEAATHEARGLRVVGPRAA